MKKTKNKNYFTEDTEKSVIAYILEQETKKKNSIYTNDIHPVFMKLTECLLSKYDNNDSENWNCTQQDLISYLWQQIPSFEPGRGKAFTYFTLIGKHWIFQKIIKANLRQQRASLLDDAGWKAVENTVPAVPEGSTNVQESFLDWRQAVKSTAPQRSCKELKRHLLDVLATPEPYLDDLRKHKVFAKIGNNCRVSKQRLSDFLRKVKNKKAEQDRTK